MFVCLFNQRIEQGNLLFLLGFNHEGYNVIHVTCVHSFTFKKFSDIFTTTYCYYKKILILRPNLVLTPQKPEVSCPDWSRKCLVISLWLGKPRLTQNFTVDHLLINVLSWTYFKSGFDLPNVLLVNGAILLISIHRVKYTIVHNSVSKTAHH